jgi:hypothetical protein
MVLRAISSKGSFRAKLLKTIHLFVACVLIEASPGSALEGLPALSAQKQGSSRGDVPSASWSRWPRRLRVRQKKLGVALDMVSRPSLAAPRRFLTEHASKHHINSRTGRFSVRTSDVHTSKGWLKA